MYLFRFSLLSSVSPNPWGSLEFNEDHEMARKVNKFFETYHSNQSKRSYKCAHNFWARDEKYLYIDLVCGKFHRISETVVETEYGYQAPTRIELDSHNEIISFEQPTDGIYNRVTYNWLFPKAVQEKDNVSANKEPWKNIHLKIQ